MLLSSPCENGEKNKLKSCSAARLCTSQIFRNLSNTVTDNEFLHFESSIILWAMCIHHQFGQRSNSLHVQVSISKCTIIITIIIHWQRWQYHLILITMLMITIFIAVKTSKHPWPSITIPHLFSSRLPASLNPQIIASISHSSSYHSASTPSSPSTSSS